MAEIEKLLESSYEEWRPQTLLAKALVLKRLGRTQELSGIYQQILARYPDTPEAEYISRL